MPRNSGGDYSLPIGTLVATGDTVLPSQHNPAFNDVAAALTGSLARSGVGGMLGPLNMNGNRITSSAPGIGDDDLATVGQTVLKTALAATTGAELVGTAAGKSLAKRLAEQDAFATVASDSAIRAAIKAGTYTLGGNFRSSLYGGSTWLIGTRYELQPDYYGTVYDPSNPAVAQASSMVDFDDACNIVVPLIGGGNGMAILQVDASMGYLRARAKKNAMRARARLSQAGSLGTATKFAVKGDSVVYGQWVVGATGATPNPTPKIGTPTNFGDGSTYAFDQLAAPYPETMLSYLNAMFGVGKCSMANLGYSGDATGQAYRRHRNGSTYDVTFIDLGRNDVLRATNNGADQTGVFVATSPNSTPNYRGGYTLEKFIDAYRLTVAREILSGAMVVLVAPGPFSSATGYNGTPYAAAQIMRYYSDAIEQIGADFGVSVIRDREITGRYAIPELQYDGIHPNDLGAVVRAARYVAYAFPFEPMGVVGTSRLTANKLLESVTGFGGLDGTAQFPTANTNSLAAPFFTVTDSADQVLGAGGAAGTMYFLVETAEDFKAAMPVGFTSGAAGISYNLNFGVTQPKRRLETEPMSVLGTHPSYPPSISLNPAGATSYNDPSDIPAHLSIVGTGRHILGVTCVSGSFALEGLLFGDFNVLPPMGSATYDPPSLVDGAGVTTTVAANGSAVGDFARASFSNDLQGLTLTAWVSAANTVSVRFQNESGATVDLASGTLRVRVEKA